MKKVMLCLILFLFATTAYANSEIRFRVADYPPFYYKDDNGNWTGIAVEQGKALIEEAGYKIVCRKSPWARALLLLEDGMLDIMGVMSINEERKKFLNFIGPHYFEQVRILISKNNHFEITKHEDIFNLPGKVALIRGTYLGEKIKNLLQNEKIKKKTIFASTSDTPSILEKLRMGRINAFIDTEIPGILKQEQFKGLKYHPFIVNADPVYFGVSKKSVDQHLLKRLQDAFERVKKRGEFEKIIKKYK